MTEIKQDGDILRFDCPHCGGGVEVKIEELACCIFRHGYYKDGSGQIGPHESKERCEELEASGNVIGCCKPFKIDKSNGYKVEICDYV